MNHQVLPFGLAVILSLVWVYFSTRLLLRSKGGPISWNPIGNRGKKLTEWQDYLGIAVVFGIGIFIDDLAYRYIRWKLYDNPSDHPQAQSVVGLLYSSLLGGVLFGLLSA